MNPSGLTSRQRRAILLMVVAVIVVFAMLAGLVMTTLQNGQGPSPISTQPFVSAPATPVPSSLPLEQEDAAEQVEPAPTSGIWSQVQAARLFDQIARQVETVRDLSPRAEVPLSFLDEQEMTELLQERYAARGAAAGRLPYSALGLLPEVDVSVSPRLAAGVYVAEQEQLYVVTRRSEDSPDDRALLAHAYAHALQDQHFDLGAMDARAATTDAALAITALVEGDAMLLAALYRYEDLEAADWDRLEELVMQAEQPSYGEELDTSAAWTALQSFPFHHGRRFAENLFQAGGWNAINRAYTAPPRSTEQLLHPERYDGAPDSFTAIIVPDLGEVLGEGWTMLLQDTLGEFVIGLHLSSLLPEEVAWQSADGWDGDTFVVWEHADGRRVLVWRTIWDSTAEAVEFERASVASVPHRYTPAWPVDPPRGLGGRWWETQDGAVYVSRAGRYVTIVHAPDVGAMENVVGWLP